MTEVISANKRLTILGVPVKIEGNVVRGTKENWTENFGDDTTEKVTMIADRKLILSKVVFPFKWFDGADRNTRLLLITWNQKKDKETLVNLDIVCGLKKTGEFEVLSASYGKGVKTAIDENWNNSVNGIFDNKEMRDWFARVTGANFYELKHD